MAKSTTNFNLQKPLDNETADIAVINENMDKIDQALKENADELINVELSKNEPQSFNKNSIWIQNMGEAKNFNLGNGVDIVNAKTSPTQPKSELWFKPL